MISLVAAVMLSCPPTKLIGLKSPLSKNEIESLGYAKKTCQRAYPEAPCLKSFEKREEQVFWAICGKP